MHTTPSKSNPAWLPLTPRGVAAFGGASWWRLLLVQLLLVAVLAVLMLATVQDTWFAGVRKLIDRLPAEGAIRTGRLEWTNEVPVTLLEGRYLAVAVDPENTGALGQEADLSVELGTLELRLTSLFGHVEVPYPPEHTISLRRVDVLAWWGAREPFLVAGVGLATALFWLVVWWVLACVYWIVVWLIGLIGSRELPAGAAMRVALAAQLPGALVFAASLISYRFGWVDLLRLGYGFALSLSVAWFYVLAAPALVPRAERRKAEKNPFSAAGGPEEPGTARRKGNPFAH